MYYETKYSPQQSFMAAGSVTLGGNLSVALGPLGRNGEALGSLNTSGKMAAMYVNSFPLSFLLTLDIGTAIPRQEAFSEASR